MAVPRVMGAPLALNRFMVKVRVGRPPEANAATGTEIVFDTCPGRNVKTPDVAV